VPYDFVLPEVWPNEPPVYPTYLRGLSYLQLHDGKRRPRSSRSCWITPAS